MNSGRTLAVILLALGLAMPTFAKKADGVSDAAICADVARSAAAETGVPFAVLMALTLTETGRSRSGQLQPWPWALNEGGKGSWFDDRDQALAYLQQAVDSGTTNVDIGCFQLNYRWHGQAFASLEEMIDPAANAAYAARLVRRLAGAEDDWIAAAGAYHSATPELAARYLERFNPIYAALAAEPESLAVAQPEKAPNGFPLIRAGKAASAGSIVPAFTSARRLIGGP